MSVRGLLRPLRLVGLLWCLLLLTAPSIALAEKPCENLNDADRDDYINLGQQANGSYAQKDYVGAIQYLVQAMDICDEDPRIQYNLARAYHKANNCNMAMYWYDRIIKLNDSTEVGRSVQKERERAGRYFTELQAECSNSAKVVIDCSDEGVRVTIGESQALRCPYEGRLDAGVYKIRAVIDDKHKPYSADIQLVAGQSNRVLIPRLEEVEEEIIKTTGIMKVSCRGEFEQVILRGQGLNERIDCGGRKELPPGVYALSIPDSDQTQNVEIVVGEIYNVTVNEETGGSNGFFLSVRVNPSIGLATGELFDENGEESFGQELDGLQPSLPSFAVSVELGYYFNADVGLGARVRFDVTNFSTMGEAFVRWVPWYNKSLALRLDVGAGGGRVVLPVQIEGGQIPLAAGGPGFGMLGFGLEWQFTKLLSFVSVIEARVGFPDLIVPIDLSIGIEVLF